MKYYVLSFNEDGDPPSLGVYTKEQLQQMLRLEAEDGVHRNFLNEDSDFDCEWGYLIIKGEVVKPRPKTVVKEWDV